jgi:DNA-binding NarL/FixJ family response regulator
VTKSPLSTYTVHRSVVVAEAMHRQLNATDGVASVGWATSASEALDKMRASLPDVWIVDERLPRSGAAVLCDRLHRDKNRGQVVVLVALGGAEDPQLVLQFVERGASGVVDISGSWSTLSKAVRVVADGGTWLRNGWSRICCDRCCWPAPPTTR